jgi:hypothetical protein
MTNSRAQTWQTVEHRHADNSNKRRRNWGRSRQAAQLRARGCIGGGNDGDLGEFKAAGWRECMCALQQAHGVLHSRPLSAPSQFPGVFHPAPLLILLYLLLLLLLSLEQLEALGNLFPTDIKTGRHEPRQNHTDRQTEAESHRQTDRQTRLLYKRAFLQVLTRTFCVNNGSEVKTQDATV